MDKGEKGGKPMSLRRKVFFRVVALITLLVVGIGSSYAVFAVHHHRKEIIGIFESKVRTCARESARLMLWDDRVALNKILRALVHSNAACRYAFIEKEGHPYVHTFDRGIPRALLGRPGPARDRISIWKFRDRAGAEMFDMAAGIGEGSAVLHVGLSREKMDLEVRPLLVVIIVLCLVGLIVGTILAILFSRWTTTEVDKLLNVLRASREQLLSIFESIDEIIYVADPETYEILFANKALRDAFHKELEGNICYRELQGLDAPCDFCTNGIIMKEKGKPYQWEYHNSALEQDFWITDRIIEWPDGRNVRFEIAINISNRKQAEVERERLLFAIEQAGEMIVITDPEGIIQYVNPAFEQITGYDREEAIGQTPRILKSGKHDEAFYRNLWETISSRNTWHGRIINKRKDGAFYTEDATISPVCDGSGRVSNFVAVKRDITKHIKLETQLQQAGKMEAMGTLAGGIAHDFNNLLMAIQGRTSIVMMGKDSSHADFEHLRGIEGHIERAADLTKQLLGFARGGKYEVRPTDLNELIKKETRMFGRTKKEVTIHEKCEENLWAADVDQGQIEQVLLNLYVNAGQAMPGGGDLYLETENVTLDETDVKPFSLEPGRYVKISVTDTGVGMDKATRERIFDPFFTTKEMGRGTGLGLASVYGIIKNHGGFISVYSEKGHGATFNIYFPASEKKVIEEKKPTGDLLRGSETVLFIDDEEMIIEVAEALLEQLGYKVLIAGSGKEAIEIYQENKERIDIVLLDMIMPDMNGGMTYNRMKEIDPDIKVLLSSGYSINGQATEILDRGCNGFIQKPFKMKELSQKLREILDEK